jgi:hypothetical protein
MPTTLSQPFALLVAVALSMLASASPAEAAAVSYDIDPAQSKLTLTGSILGNVLVPQFTGSNVLVFDGTLNADVGGGQISFSGLSNIDANLLATPVTPRSGGAAGSAPGDAGVYPGNSGNGSAAIRDFVLDLTSGAIPVAGDGQFDAGGVIFTIIGGKVDYAGLLTGSTTIIGNTVTTGPNMGTLALNGNTETLTLPAMLQFLVDVDNQTAGVTLPGTIVATRQIPEPSTGVLAVLAFGLMWVLRKRFK